MHTQYTRKEVFPASYVNIFFPKNSNMTPFNFVKIVFQKFFHLKPPEVVFSPYVSIFPNKYKILIKLILRMHGTTFSLYSILAELSSAHNQYKFNLVPRILSISSKFGPFSQVVQLILSMRGRTLRLC